MRVLAGSQAGKDLRAGPGIGADQPEARAAIGAVPML